MKKKYNKYYNGDFKVLSNKKDKIGNVAFVKVTYQTSIDAHEHAVVVMVRTRMVMSLLQNRKILIGLTLGI